MKALLKRNHVSYGSGLEDWKGLAAKAKTEASKALIDALRDKPFSPEEQAVLRRGSLPVQAVEVLDVYDQSEAAHLYATPTPSQMVALVRGVNFDGEQVEIVVALSDLAGIPGDDSFAEKFMQCVAEWHGKISNAGHD